MGNKTTILLISLLLFSCASKKVIIKEKTTFTDVVYVNPVEQEIFKINLSDVKENEQIIVLDDTPVAIERPKKFIIKVAAKRKVFHKDRIIVQVDSIEVLIDSGKVSVKYINSEAKAQDKTLLKSRKEIVGSGFFDKIEIWLSAIGFIVVIGLIYYIRRKK